MTNLHMVKYLQGEAPGQGQLELFQGFVAAETGSYASPSTQAGRGQAGERGEKEREGEREEGERERCNLLNSLHVHVPYRY